MWTYVVWVGVGMLLDPVRIGIAALLMSRRRAMVNLLAFWIGGMVAGALVGVAVLVLLHDIALVAIQSGISTINDVRSAVIFLTGEHLRITIGVVALTSLAIMLARDRAKMKTLVTVGAGPALDAAPRRRAGRISWRRWRPVPTACSIPASSGRPSSSG